MWNNVQKNIGAFQSLFGSKNFIIVDNNDAGEDIFNKVYKRIRGIVVKKPTKPAAKFWIKSELQKKAKAGGVFKGKIKTSGRRGQRKRLDVTDTGTIN
jgi:hypothetical protein